MTVIKIKGQKSLYGTIQVSGAKNAVLPIMAASLLTPEPVLLIDSPVLADVRTMRLLLETLGAKIKLHPDGRIRLDNSNLSDSEAPYDYVRKMRASFLVLGPLLARTGHARISLPGGCAIGTRPIDLHLKGLTALGAEITTGHGYVEAWADSLSGARVYMDFPSVGATENLMMTASLAKGTTVIENAAEEPEIVDLANFINGMGGRVTGAGTNIIKIEGQEALHGTTHGVIPDRIEAGTFMVMAAATGGDVLVNNVISDHLKPVIAKLQEMGVEITELEDGIRVRSAGTLKPVDIKTLPYPGFPTDMQAQIMALLSMAPGTSVITETVFENRFMHINELKRMGADVTVEGHSAVVKGVDTLTGAHVKATDLRAGAALIIAGMMAEGETIIGGLQHIDRGYQDIVQKLSSIGADIRRVEEDDRDCYAKQLK